METIIAIILIVIMLLLDTHSMETFLDRAKTFRFPIKLNPNITTCNTCNTSTVEYMNNTDSSIQDLYKPPLVKKHMWIFNDYTVSSRNWKDFYSRRHRQPTPAIVNLCIKTILAHSKDYNVHIFNQDDIETLLPEYMEYIKACSSHYMATNFIKYATLYKYGGIWVPKDTILLKPIYYNIANHTDYVTTFGSNNLNLIDNKGVTDNMLAVSANNTLINNMLIYLKSNSRTFQNGLLFKKSINKYFNKLLINCTNCETLDIYIIKKHDQTHIKISDLFSSNIVRFDNKDNRALGINISEIDELPIYNYILRMSEGQILQSGLFISKLFRKVSM